MNNIWWKESIIYQIYPRSYKDSTGNGVGDLRGIIEKLDYVQSLGVDVIWLGPIYDSPNDDNGYDIRDYYKIHPEFGTMAEFDMMLKEMHARGLKLLMDLVVNHTSDEHEWFEESRKNKDNPYRDYYFWKPPATDGGPPNNWQSFFGGSAWEYDDTTGEYYLHLFTKKQPDVNWENPEVRKKNYEIIQYWLDKGVDGFRMDVIPLISKNLSFQDAPYPSFNEVVEKVYSNGPRVHEFLKEMNREVLSGNDIMTIGEGPGINKDLGINYVGHDRDELNLIFHLDHMFLGQGNGGKFDPVPFNLIDIKRIFNGWDEAMGESGWISIFLDNHDFSRMVSRFGNDGQYRKTSAKLLITMILTLRGTPSIYQGSEIGMTNVAFDTMDDYDDVETLNFYKQQQKKGVTEKEFLPLAHELSRDNVRTPMQWSDNRNAGFTDGTPWIKLNPNYNHINVKNAEADQSSILHFYREMIAFRKARKTFTYGRYKDLSKGRKDIFHYKRWGEHESYQVILNFTESDVKLSSELKGYELIKSNYINTDVTTLGPWEARVYHKK